MQCRDSIDLPEKEKAVPFWTSEGRPQRYDVMRKGHDYNRGGGGGMCHDHRRVCYQSDSLK